MFSKNVDRNLRNSLVSKSRFTEVSNLGKYLGVPLIGRAPKRADFQYLLEKIKKKLTGWKARPLSLAGRVTLAKSVIAAMAIYPMMAAAIPKGVLRDIEKIQRDFVWGDEVDHRRHHAVSWDVITKPKQIGGLGLRKLTNMNSACLMKLGWDLRRHSTALWCQVLRGKYGRTRIGDTHWISKGTDSSLWKHCCS